MATTYSSNLGIQLIGTGEQSGTWGTTTNTNLGTLIEQAISGYVTQAITDGADTVITIPDGATGVARNMYIEMTGALTAARNLIVPTNKKLYFVYNNTTGGYAVTVKVSGQTGVSVPNGVKMILVSNGTDVVSAVSYFASLTLGSALPVASGGTNSTATPTAGAVAYGNGTAYAFNTAGTSGQALLSGGAGTPTFGTLGVGAGGTGLTSTPSNGQIDIGNGAGFTRATLTAGSGVSITNGSGTITIATTGGGGTVTSVGLTAPAFLSVSGSPVTGSGTLGLSYSGTPLPVANGGTGLTSYTANGILYASGTGTIASGSALQWTGTNLAVSGGASTPVVAVTFSATAMTVNCQLSNTFSTTFTANVTVAPTISNPSDGQTINWRITQDATGSRTMTWPTSFKWAGGAAGVLSTAANSVDMLVATYYSSTGYWYASLSKGFA
jgi:hypothetical protein